MAKEQLKQTGSDQSLKQDGRSDSIRTSGYESPSGNSNSSQQLNVSERNQQLHSGINEADLYRSEDRQKELKNTSQSFNDQRNLYAEQAMNSKGYDYQAVIYLPEDGESREEFKRYATFSSETASDSAGREEKGSKDGEGGRSFSSSERASIFEESDVELASSINYLDEHSEANGKKLEKIDKKLNKTKDKIQRLEERGLEYRISYKPWNHRLVIDKKDKDYYKNLYNHHDYHAWHKGKRIHVTKKTHIKGRLKFQSEKIAYTESTHRQHERNKYRKEERNRYRLKQAAGVMRNAASGSSFQEDEVMRELNRKGRRATSALARYARHHVRQIGRELDGYNRLKFQNTRQNALNARKELLNYRSGIDLQKRKAEEAAKQQLNREKSKHKLKKEMVQKYKHEQGNFFERADRQRKLKRTVKKEKKMAVKRAKRLISSGLALLAVIFLTFFFIMSFFTIFLNIGLGGVASSTSQNDYSTMTDATAYFREKETALEYRFNSENPDNIEHELLAEHPDIYEFIYQLDEISFDANTLVAYLSAKYIEFNLDLVKDDLNEIFDLYYTLRYEIKQEEREIIDISQLPDPETGEYPKIKKQVPICYVFLEKKDFYELLQSRLDETKQSQMDTYFLSGNGQQVYGPVMAEDWRNKISSNFGIRIHPITGEQKMHDGVDIAIPTGTALYSAVKGTVIQSKYSDSAGNMITVQTDTGWQITFMHMDSRAVSVGEQIEQGQYVGTSGNTGNSTGPHLHMQVHDAEGNFINPVFIIPFAPAGGV